MILYNQSGLLTIGGVEFTAYSGHGIGLNRPEAEIIPNTGPIPRGQWQVVEWVDHYEDKGSVVARLAPVGFDPHGRSGFLCHGNTADGGTHASEGCIVTFTREPRDIWRASGDMDLMVI